MAKVRVLRHMADDDKDTYTVEMKGQAGDLISGCMIDCKIVLKAKTDEILQRFPRGTVLQVDLGKQT